MAERFAAGWLALREPADHAARSEALLVPLNDALAERARPLNVVDLGSGAGSNLRYLAPRLAGPQHWTLVDHDAGLLATVAEPEGAVATARQVLDFSEGPPPIPHDADLVTASALLDLVSADWLHQLVAACTQQQSVVLFALNYDGRIEWSKPDPLDALVLRAINGHQRRDKGLGPALGPEAAEACARALAVLAYRVEVRNSDWYLGAEEVGLGEALIRGWVEAAAEQVPQQRAAFHGWGVRRTAELAAGDVTLGVGHRDLLGWPDIRT
ncbi:MULTISPECIES: class I SAM-dependent methyltransferase [Thioalkalivibrio]|uniref:class I SAM-dependent methyltransferase n=1 Tax=Thioalkalivibrio TaxID=106633 RepID=UPI00036754D7|nr:MULTISPECIES: class I SAM-dependent methyltransferase [Thioalkalivibrio]